MNTQSSVDHTDLSLSIEDIGKSLRTLNFFPLKKWPPILPPVVWDQWLLSGFDRSDGLAIYLSCDQITLSCALKQCYQELSIAEIARLMTCIENTSPSLLTLQISEILNQFRIHPSDDSHSTLRKIATLPLGFQNWLSHRMVSIGELSILSCYSDLTPLVILFEILAQCQPSKNLGVQALDMAGEIILQGRGGFIFTEPLPSDAPEFEKWFLKLKHLRYPNTLSADGLRENQLRLLPWPSHCKARWIRDGDRSGIDIRFTAANQRELDRFITGLTCVSKSLDSDSTWSRL